MTQDALRHWRRDLHRLPEAAWCEFRTSALIAHHLCELGFSVMLGDKLLASNLIMGREIDVAAQKERALRQGAHPDWLARIDEITGVMGFDCRTDFSGFRWLCRCCDCKGCYS